MTSKLIPANPEKVMVIRSVTPDITTLSVPFLRFGHIKIGGRGTLVRLQSGSLAVFSPAALTEEVKKTVSSLGPLKYIVALDIEHHIFLSPWSKAYPEAKVIGMEGLPEKREAKPETKGTTFSTIYTAKERNAKVSEEFDAEFDVEYMPSHANKEVVVFHKPSKTLIEADLLFNLPATEQFSKAGVPANTGFLTKLFVGIMNTRGTPTWQRRFNWYAASKADRKGFTESIARIEKWDFERIIPCHGDVIETNGKGVFQSVFEWHLKQKN